MPEEQPAAHKLPHIGFKTAMAIPLVILAVALGYLGWTMATTGLALDIDLRGGTQITFETTSLPSAAAIETALHGFEANARVARGVTTNSVLIDVGSEVKAEDIVTALHTAGFEFATYSVQTVGPALSSSFLQQAQVVLVVAFAFMAIAIFAIFKLPLPSMYVILCGFADMAEALAFSQILGIKLSLATFAALLMVVGYSVDTDVLLTSRVLRGAEPDLGARISGARKTGMTMIFATIAALAAMLIVGTSSVITQIAGVLLIALIVDIPNTWLLNASLLRWYMERRAKKA